MKSQKEFGRIQCRQNEDKTDNVDTSGFDNPAQSFVVGQVALEPDDLENNLNYISDSKAKQISVNKNGYA